MKVNELVNTMMGEVAGSADQIVAYALSEVEEFSVNEGLSYHDTKALKKMVLKEIAFGMIGGAGAAIGLSESNDNVKLGSASISRLNRMMKSQGKGFIKKGGDPESWDTSGFSSLMAKAIQKGRSMADRMAKAPLEKTRKFRLQYLKNLKKGEEMLGSKLMTKRKKIKLLGSSKGTAKQIQKGLSGKI